MCEIPTPQFLRPVHNPCTHKSSKFSSSSVLLSLDLPTALRGAIRRDVRGREESFSVADLPVPPVLVLAICHRDHVAPPKVQLAGFLWHKVVQRLHEHLLRHHVLQFHVLGPRDARRAVVVHELVQRVEFDHPQEELALRVTQYLKVLHAVRTPRREAAIRVRIRTATGCIAHVIAILT